MAIKTIYGTPTFGANLELLMMMGEIKIKHDLKVVPYKLPLKSNSKLEAFAVEDLDEAEDSYWALSILGHNLRRLNGPMKVSKHYGTLKQKTDYDRFHYTVFRFTTREKRDEVRKAFHVFDSNNKPVPNIDDYIATGTDEQGFYFMVQRGRDVEETVVFTYTDDGSILKNNVNPESYRNIFDQ